MGNRKWEMGPQGAPTPISHRPFPPFLPRRIVPQSYESFLGYRDLEDAPFVVGPHVAAGAGRVCQGEMPAGDAPAANLDVLLPPLVQPKTLLLCRSRRDDDDLRVIQSERDEKELMKD